MFDALRSRCPCGGRIRKVEFYLDPYRRWDHYYCCNSCGAHGDTVGACQLAAPPQATQSPPPSLPGRRSG